MDGEGATYYFTRKRDVARGERAEIERMISREEYEHLLKRKDPRRNTIEKRRVCFFWKERHFEMDFFEAPMRVRGLVLLEAERGRADGLSEIELPSFIESSRDVTHRAEYSNAYLALKRDPIPWD